MKYTSEISVIRFLSQNADLYDNNIFCLRSLLNGFWYRNPYMRDYTLEHLYQDWIEMELIGEKSSLSWAEILFLYSGSNPNAVILFFETIEKFHNEEIRRDLDLIADDRFIVSNSIIETLQSIRDRVMLYLSKPEITCLAAFIEGWFLRDSSNVVDRELFMKFQEYIVQRYNPLKEGQGTNWKTCMYVYGQPNCIQNFYERLDDYLTDNT